ncbi:hypothetical protein IW261DRAFT_1425664 [Armillaria novae-zelandiae]|uniref:Uncharacterized protein n=1 Tax=Armillaria novae-zelandiae TaxID=153914 RepID=A0AA39NS32_9AGAR|nr:hypothetical protein IW261DRAFT_1425664 [Armillaria novae-zelandiae]
MCQHYFQTRRGNKHVKSLMSAFVDLEAGVNREEVLEASEEEITDFIQDAPDEDDISDVDDAPTTGPSMVAPVLGIPEQEKMWTDLLERASLRATRGQTVLDTNNKNSIHDVPPEFWALSVCLGWEDIVVFHIGRCARPELGIKAAFIMPLLEKQVWLEVEMSYTLKAWLQDIPGVRLRNQQPILHALSPLDGFGAPLSTNSSKPLDPSARDKKHGKRRRLDDNLAPKLFNRGAIELDGSEKLKVLNKGEEQYLWCDLVYKYDLLVRRISFSQVEMAREIPDSLAGLFAQSCHPLVRRYRQKLPRISEWCLVVGDPIMDTSSGKTFQVGQYVEITEDCVDRWAGWIHAIEDGLVHVVSHNARMNDKVEMHEVHPNLVMVSTPPSSLPLPLKKDQDPIRRTKECPWKGTLVLIVRRNHRWRGKTGYVEDAIVVNNPSGKPVLSLLIRLASYNPNMPYLTLWFEYLDVVDEESYLPLNEALPLADNDDNLYHKHVTITYVLEEKGRRVYLEPEPQAEADPGNRTPLPDPAERCLSPAWDPSALEPGSSLAVSSLTYWCTDQRLHGFQFRAKYQGLNIVAAVRAKLNGSDGLKCVREDTSLHEELDPAAVLPIHPTARHYDMFLVISGEHCGKWVRGIQYKKISPKDRSDLEWMVAVVIPRTPFMHDDLMDERLVLHSSCMTLANETVISRNLNEGLRRQLRKPARER